VPTARLFVEEFGNGDFSGLALPLSRGRDTVAVSWTNRSLDQSACVLIYGGKLIPELLEIPVLLWALCYEQESFGKTLSS